MIPNDEHLKPCLLIYLCNICIYGYLYTKRIHVHSRSLTEHPADILLLLSQDFLFVENGSIVEEGTHGELLALNGRYRAMWEAELHGFSQL